MSAHRGRSGGAGSPMPGSAPDPWTSRASGQGRSTRRPTVPSGIRGSSPLSTTACARAVSENRSTAPGRAARRIGSPRPDRMRRGRRRTRAPPAWCAQPAGCDRCRRATPATATSKTRRTAISATGYPIPTCPLRRCGGHRADRAPQPGTIEEYVLPPRFASTWTPLQRVWRRRRHAFRAGTAPVAGRPFLPPPTYSPPGGLRQDPGRAAHSPDRARDLRECGCRRACAGTARHRSVDRRSGGRHSGRACGRGPDLPAQPTGAQLVRRGNS
jgi:hypothetical protein